jgi:hypothetical protein
LWRTACALLGLGLGGCLLPEVTFEQTDASAGGLGGTGGDEMPAAGTGGDAAAGGTSNELGAGGTAVARVCAVPPCADAEPCLVATDCASGVCAPLACSPEVASCCQAPACSDGIANGDEPVIDCGNVACGPCAVDHACLQNENCASGSCVNGACAPVTCLDTQLNGTETGIDCGGSDPACARCADGITCSVGPDCASGTCLDGVCISCSDQLLNGTETDTDCGGVASACARCAPGRLCLADTDCTSGVCQGGRCCGGTGVDCTRCAERLTPSVSCADLDDDLGDQVVTNCAALLTCLTNNPMACPTRSAPQCSGAGDVCDLDTFNGQGNPAVDQALAILQAAACAP